MGSWVEKELIVTGRAVICASWIIVVVGGFNAVVVGHQGVFFLTRELNVRRIPTDLALANSGVQTVSLGSTGRLANC
jgi:hypothetical protein